MAKYRITAPDGGTYEITAPDDASQEQVLAYAQSNYQKPAPKQEPAKDKGVMQGIGNAAAGLLRGAGSIGATLLAPVDIASDALNGKGLSLDANLQRRADMDSALQGLGAQPDSWMYKGGKIGGEILGTAGAGGVLGNVAARLGASTPVVQAITSSGFSAGGRTGLAGMATRAAGGALTGGVTAAAVNPEDAATGAALGAALPIAVQGAGKVAGAMSRGVRNMRAPVETRAATKIADLVGMKPGALADALVQPGPSMIPGYKPTVPQIMQDPTISQLQRTLKTAGTNAIGEAERAQQAQLRAALERVAPIDLSVQDAAERAGGAIDDYAKSAYKEAGKKVTAAFNAVDPFNESAVMLPLDEMLAARGKYLGAGTFGDGSKAAQAIATAQEVGTMALPAVKAIPQSAGRVQTLEQAVRSHGGIRPGDYLGREIAELGRKQSKTTGLVAKTGRDVEAMANAMFERGFIPDNDPATLLDVLRNGGGRNSYANDAMEAGFQRMADNVAGDLPGAEVVRKAVPFETVQNLRASIGEAAQQAKLAGSNKEAAALRGMVESIDDSIERIAGGGAQQGEYFAPDMVSQYKSARELHAAKKLQFETGPQIGMFRQGGDGVQALQGAEIPGKFFNGKRSQADDVAAFKRLIGDRADLADELKRYAVTEAASTSNASGDLTSKYIKWMESRSGAARELFSDSEMATLREVGNAVEKSLKAENLGRVSGSDTAQKLAALNNMGLLDNKAVSLLANRIPIVGQFTGPMLSGLRETAIQRQNKQLAGLLADPDALAAALRKSTPGDAGLLRLMRPAGRGLLQVAPVISAQ